MAGLKDIAARTGLSINTVSRALRDRGYISAATRAQVEAATAELGYQPNRAARSLRFKRNFEIAVICTISDGGRCDSLAMEKVIGMKHCLAAAGYELTLHFPFADAPKKSQDDKLFDTILSQNPAGIVFLGESALEVEMYLRAAEKKIPAVIISNAACSEMNSVYIDRQGGVCDAVKYLAEQGRKNICFAGYSGGHCNRLVGYNQAMHELGMPGIIISVKYRYSQLSEIFDLGCRTAREIIDKHPEIDAIQAYSDYLAAGLCAGFARQGVRAPEDISIIGFDNRDLAMFSNPPLTTLAQPNRQVGEAAVELLLARIAEPRMKPQSVRIPMQLICRNSA